MIAVGVRRAARGRAVDRVGEGQRLCFAGGTCPCDVVLLLGWNVFSPAPVIDVAGMKHADVHGAGRGLRPGGAVGRVDQGAGRPLIDGVPLSVSCVALYDGQLVGEDDTAGRAVRTAAVGRGVAAGQRVLEDGDEVARRRRCCEAHGVLHRRRGDRAADRGELLHVDARVGDDRVVVLADGVRRRRLRAWCREPAGCVMLAVTLVVIVPRRAGVRGVRHGDRDRAVDRR